ncbi:MAG: CerR family C-terminal domain-containing protein [Verrucomicrobia bacterium]|nr:CerR family C-terminal domain-containing protein [Verrucomicrobiota bacterium]
MADQTQSETPDRTRRTLLLAAGEVFAECGFRAATVREICRRAGANIAAVNYHFGDKEALYTEVLQHALQAAREKYPPSLGLPPGAPAKARLRAFVLSFLLRIFDEGPHAHHGKLMVREMAEPTLALDAVVRDQIRPMSGQLAGIVAELLGARATPELVRACSLSVVSQVMFYHLCRPVIGRLFPEMKFDRAQIDQLAAHITEFSLHALRNAKATSSAKPSPRARLKAKSSIANRKS